MDAPFYSKSGHQGTAMALAPLAHVIFSRIMRHDPMHPHWPDRDRFILSNGHASILHYSMLYLNGYGLGLDDIKAFRQWDSLTPGHPEAGHTTGIEVTTGPLGQGVANSVGMAIAERILADRFGTDLQSHHTFVLAGDGCFMEGVSHEAASLAGHLGLGSLVMVYDDNHITIDGDTNLTYDDNVPQRFEAYGWHVEQLGEMANDLDGLEAAIRRAMAVIDKPSLLVLRSHIADPSPDLTDNHKAHGNPFTLEQINNTKDVMGIPQEPFWAPTELVDAYRAHAAANGKEAVDAWQARFDASDIDKAAWDACWNASGIAGWTESLPTFEQGAMIPTREAIQTAFDATIAGVPGLVAGAADLTGNTGTKLAGQTIQARDTPGGRQVHYGIREHGMGSAMVGMAKHGGIIPAGGTFFVFLDYMRPPVRLAALSKAKVLFVFTHDSVGVGEDGPTHQPIEHIATLRAIPHLQVIRPADANETAQAWRVAVEHDGPTALVLSRQAVPVVTDGSAVEVGAATIVATTSPQVVLVGTGSEVHVCVAAAATLAERGINANVVSMPSWDRFAAQDTAHRQSVFPTGVPVLSVEAGVTFGWAAYADESIGIDRFGASAPGALVLDKLGINADHVVARAAALVAAATAPQP
ncbi:MAG: tkt [Acidimicrobiales bacterium]|nr:tkt [Acidimicrobiales bacterium]